MDDCVDVFDLEVRHILKKGEGGISTLPFYATCLILHFQPESWLRRGRLW